MRLGLAIGPDVPARFELARQMGAKGLMVFAEEVRGDGSVEALHRRFADEGLEIAQVGCWSFNPAAATEAGIAEVRRAIDLAAGAGRACTVVFGAGGLHPTNPWAAHPDNWTPDARQKVARAVRPLARAAERAGVRLVLEPHLVNVARDGPTTRELLDRIGSPSVGVCADLVNYCTFAGLWDNRALIDSVLGPLAGRCFAAHLKDVALEERLIIHMNECPAGQGRMDFVHLLRRLSEALARDDWAIVEHTPPDVLGEAVQYVKDKGREAGVELEWTR